MTSKAPAGFEWRHADTPRLVALAHLVAVVDPEAPGWRRHASKARCGFRPRRGWWWRSTPPTDGPVCPRCAGRG